MIYLAPAALGLSQMAVPAPTPYVPSKYSTSSADDFNGEPLIEVLHQHDFDTTDDYLHAILQWFISIIAGGLVLWFLMWCINCCACCKCCRERLPCCFAIFKNHKTRKVFTPIPLPYMNTLPPCPPPLLPYMNTLPPSLDARSFR